MKASYLTVIRYLAAFICAAVAFRMIFRVVHDVATSNDPAPWQMRTLIILPVFIFPLVSLATAYLLVFRRFRAWAASVLLAAFAVLVYHIASR